MKRIRQILSWISREIVILSKISIGFGKYFWKLLKKVMKVIWKGGLKMKALIFRSLFLIGLLTGLAVGIIFFGWIFIVVTFGTLVFLVILIYFVLAPKNLFFTFVEEGTIKVVVRGSELVKVKTAEGKVAKVTKGGQVLKALIQWKDYTLDKEWNVVPDGKEIDGRTYKELWHPFGGLRFYGLWPFDRIYSYKFRWTGIHEDGKPEAHEEIIDWVMLKDFVYYAELKDAEEKEMVPLTIGLLQTMRIVNPYKALFKVEDWIELVINRTKPLFREYIAKHTYKELISEKQAVGGKVWVDITKSGLVDEFETDYGVKIKDGGIEMKDITPPPKYQEAATLKYLAERTKERRVIETVGTVVESMAESRGKTPKQIQRLIEADQDLKKEFLDLSKDLIIRQMGIDGKAYLDIRTVAGEPGKTILDALAAWLRMPMGGKEKEEKELSPEKEETEGEKLKRVKETFGFHF